MLFYLIGIKGSGMAALGKILIKEGHIVYGVDEEKDYYTTKGLDISFDSFYNMKLSNAYFYIIGNAYKNHSVTNYIKRLGYYNMDYPDFISYHFKALRFICVSGSHGKTFTTTLLKDMLEESAALVGDGYGRAGKNNLILESCEYRDTFLHYNPGISLILNIDYDHPDYFKTENDYIESFYKFAGKSKICILNKDDSPYKRFNDSNIITYGITNADIEFNYRIEKSNTIVNVLGNEFVIPYPGRHYAYNFMGSYIILKLLGIDDDFIKIKLNSISLPERRFQIRIINQINYVLDYAHHPTEIKALYESVKYHFNTENIILFFEPHTITRSEAFKYEFKNAFSLFKNVYLLDTFTSVRENMDLKRITKLYNYFGYERINKEKILNFKYHNSYIYCFLGAGIIDTIYNELLINKEGK